jgi:hypothetical protein
MTPVMMLIFQCSFKAYCLGDCDFSENVNDEARYVRVQEDRLVNRSIGVNRLVDFIVHGSFVFRFFYGVCCIGDAQNILAFRKIYEAETTILVKIDMRRVVVSSA